MLVFRKRVEVGIGYIATPVIKLWVTQFDGNGVPVGMERAKFKLNVIKELLWSSLVFPVVARMIDHHVENNPNRERLAILLEIMSRINKFDQVVLGSEMRINFQVVVGIV